MIKAIETVWRGYRFRSRLEARWAVFFEQLLLPWEYEPQGFELPEGGRYLPDFLIREHGRFSDLWIEVKPKKQISESELTRFCKFACLAVESDGASSAMLAKGDPLEPSVFWITRQRADQLSLDQFFTIFRNLSGMSFREVDSAALAARQARFEHGEAPA